mgnify:CR=1 FL=1
MAKLTFIGHATFAVEADDGTHLVIDPFLADNPVTDVTVDDLAADFDLVHEADDDRLDGALGFVEHQTRGIALLDDEHPVAHARADGVDADARLARGIAAW